MANATLRVAVISPYLIAISCTDSGEDTAEASDAGPSAEASQDSGGVLYPDLAGTLVWIETESSRGSGTLVSMDAASGRYRSTRPESWVTDVDTAFVVERNGSTGLVEGCAALGGSSGANCVYVQGEDGSTLSAFFVESDAFGYALGSPGRERVALFRTLSGFQADDWVLEVYRSDGLLLDVIELRTDAGETLHLPFFVRGPETVLIGRRWYWNDPER